MSPNKLKSKERQAARDRKSTARQVASAGTSANAYNPVSGTFHAIESISTENGVGYTSGRFRTIDDGDDNGSSQGGGADIECMSNNGSYSGESEDQSLVNGKEKQGAGKSGSQSGVVGGVDTRDKVRGKNERKHQRQKERRAQELKDKCTSYLMSRKLESLSQQLVAMGFSQERATMALILNDGHVERSVAWLLEGGESQVHEDWNSGGNSKIDITEELAYIVEIEKKYKFLRPDIERAVVSCEGDLPKALESLLAQGWSTSPGREEGHTVHVISNQSPVTRKEESSQPRSNGVVIQPAYQTMKDERVPTKPIKGRPQNNFIGAHAPPEILTRGSHLPKKLSGSPIDLQSSFLPAERQMRDTRIALDSVKNQSQYAPQHASVSKPHTGLVFGAGTTDPKMFPVSAREINWNTTSREAVNTGHLHLLVRGNSQPQGVLSNGYVSSPVTSLPALSSTSQNHSFMEGGSPSNTLYTSAGHGGIGMREMNAGKKSMKSLESGASDLIGYLNQVGSFLPESPAYSWGYGHPNETSVPPGLSSALHYRSSSGSSYGLFTGWGASLSQSSVDWNTGPLQNCDYRNIDWSMNASPTTTRGVSSRMHTLASQERGNYFWVSNEERGFNASLGSSSFASELTQHSWTWKVGASRVAVQENTSNELGSTTGHEWTTPFAGKDLFKLPQAVPSPSL